MIRDICEAVLINAFFDPLSPYVAYELDQVYLIPHTDRDF